jgi:WD40 repeat protein
MGNQITTILPTKSPRQQRCERAISWLAMGALPIQGICRIIAGYSNGLDGTCVSVQKYTGRVNHLAVLPESTPESALVWASNERGLSVWLVGASKVITADVLALSVLRDGRLAMSTYANHRVEIWDIAHGLCVSLVGHFDVVYAIAELSGGQIASGSRDHTVRVWDMVSSECIRVLCHPDRVVVLATLWCGRLVSGCGDKTLCVWDVVTGQCVRVIRHPSGVCALVVLPCNRLVSSGCDETTCVYGIPNHIYVWDTVSGMCLQILQGHANHVCAIAVLSDGTLASASWDNTICIWDTVSGKCLRVLGGHTGTVHGLVGLPDCQLVSIGRDKTLRVWE